VRRRLRLETALARLEAMPLDEVPPRAGLPTGSWVPYHAHPGFVGREGELRALAAALRRERTAALAGPDGMGKTHIAVEFVHRYGTFFSGGVFWLNFADPAAVPAQVALCGGPGGMDLRPDFSSLSMRDQVRLVRMAWDEPVPRLVVFDDCEEEQAIAAWRPGPNGAHLLVTGRHQAGQVPELPPLSPAESSALLRAHTPDLADAEAGVLADVLGGLPLALVLAAGCLRGEREATAGRPVVERLQTLDVDDLRGLGLPDDPSRPGRALPAARAFMLGWQALDPTDSLDALALALLARTAHLAPGQPIPRYLLCTTLNRSDTRRQAGRSEPGSDRDHAVEQALARLFELALLETTADGSPVVHPLLARWVRAVSPDVGAGADVEAGLLAAAEYVNGSVYPGPLLAWQGHLRAVVEAARLRRDTRAAALCAALARHLEQIEDYPGAITYLELALAMHEEQLGGDHPDLARELDRLGGLFRNLGAVEMAQPYLERALQIRERALGAEHPETAVSLNRLGQLFSDMGQPRRAQRYYEQALHIWQRTSAEDHPQAAQTLNYLGGLLQDAGDLRAARRYYERALNIRVQALGEDHPDTAQSLNNLASILYELGDLAAAQLYLERALRVHEQVLGPDHPDTAQSFSNLGMLLHTVGDRAGARRCYEEALRIRRAALGEDHPQTAASLARLAALLHELGDLDGLTSA
jgi:tetratricopeptide (TPR) repeat protein